MRLHKSTSIFVDTPFTIFSYNLVILSPAVNCRESYDTCISCQLQRTMVRSWKSIWFCNLGPFLGTQTKTIKAFFIHCEVDPLCAFGNILHDDVIKWKHFPRYWPFVRGIHRSPVNSPHKGQWRGALIFSLIAALNKRLSRQSWGWWFETPSHPLWRHCDGPV